MALADSEIRAYRVIYSPVCKIGTGEGVGTSLYPLEKFINNSSFDKSFRSCKRHAMES